VDKRIIGGIIVVMTMCAIPAVCGLKGLVIVACLITGAVYASK
jgi:hypothetical protein